MRRLQDRLSLVLGVLIVACSAPAAGQTGSADLVFRNGAIYTVNPAHEWAEAVAIEDGRIVAVGSADVEGWIGPQTRIVNLDGKMLLPGFGDSHVHPIGGGIGLGECNLAGVLDREELLTAIGGCGAVGQPDEWIRGGRWFLFLFPDGNPHKATLDEIAPGRPVFLRSVDGHSSWASSRALEMAAITRETPDPPNGRIERDPTTGEPTGTLREYASRMVSRLLPDYTFADRLEGVRIALQYANSLGITQWQDASADRESMEMYTALDERGELTARVVTALRTDVLTGLDNLPRLTALREEFGSERLRPTAVKIGADGVIYAQTAVLLEPYLDRPGDRGEPFIEPQALQELVAALDAEDFQVHIHAVGDAAVRYSLDAFEHARELNGARDSRHHIAHIDLAHPDDFPRFAELGAIANFQPLWAQRDQYIVDLVEPLIGLERARWGFPVGSIVAAQGRIAFGSDWPVSTINPLDILQVAVTRAVFPQYRRPGSVLPEGMDGSGPGWHPQERIDLKAAIAAYTIDVAYLNFLEEETGSIDVGKYADLVVLDRNLFEIPPADIHKAQILLTLLEGESVYEDPAWSW